MADAELEGLRLARIMQAIAGPPGAREVLRRPAIAAQLDGLLAQLERPAADVRRGHRRARVAALARPGVAGDEADRQGERDRQHRHDQPFARHPGRIYERVPPVMRVFWRAASDLQQLSTLDRVSTASMFWSAIRPREGES